MSGQPPLYGFKPAAGRVSVSIVAIASAFAIPLFGAVTVAKHEGLREERCGCLVDRPSRLATGIHRQESILVQFSTVE